MRPSLVARLPDVLWIAVTVVFALAPGTAPAADVMEEFAQALRRVPNLENEGQVKAHQKLLKEKAAALVRPGDLRRALMLPELRHQAGPQLDAAPDEANPLGKTYQEIWADLAQRLKTSLRRGLRAEDAGRRLAAVTFLAVMAEDEEREGGAGPPGVRQDAAPPRFTLDMADDLRKVLSDDKDPAVCAAAAAAVVTIHPEAKETLEALKPLLAPKRQAAERRAAAEGLGRMLRRLAEGQRFGNAGPGVERAPPVSGLDRLGPDIVAAAGPGLGDEDTAVRRACLEVIRQAAHSLGETRVVPHSLARAVNARTKDVAGRLDDEDVDVRLSALRTLEAVATARGGLRNTEEGAHRPGWRPEDAALLDDILKALPKLAKCLGNDEVRVRLGALYVLETLGDGAAPAVEAVAGRLKEDKNGFVRWGAARALNNMPPQAPDRAVPALAAALADDNATVRLTAVAALRRYGDKAAPAVEKLGKAVGDSEPRVRAGAIHALAAVGAQAGSQSAVLVRALKEDRTPAVRAAAAEALGRLGRLPAGAAEALRDALHDSDADVRRAAGDALLDAPSR